MSGDDSKSSAKVEQFRNLSELDKGLLGRLVQDRSDKHRGGNITNPDLSPIRNVFHRTLRDTADIRNIFQVMPDLHLPREILVSAICAPGDLAQSTLIFGNELQEVDSSLIAPMTQLLENFYTKDKKMAAKVPEWVDDALVWSGAHPILIIPEASLDRMITGAEGQASMESVASFGGEWDHDWFKPKGFLGLRVPGNDRDGFVSFESSKHKIDHNKMSDYHTIKAERGEKKVTLPFRVTDNMVALRMPAVQSIKRERAMRSAFGTTSLESRRRQRQAEKADKVGGKSAPSNFDVYNRYFKAPRGMGKSRLEVVPTLKQTTGPNNGHPLEYHLATEAVMPIHVPGDETNHVGYLILLDMNGFPISFSRRMNFYEDIRKGAAGMGTGSQNQVSGEVLQIAKEVMSGNIQDASTFELDRLAAMHGQFIENDIIARLKSGLMGGDFELGRTEQIDRLMLARSMKNQMTTMLYVPAELMIYMAYDFNEYGVGKSILEDAKALAAMRAAVTMANVIGSTKNAIPGKDINIELDPDDGDPVGAATFMASEALGLAYHTFPMSLSSAAGLAEQLQMGAFSVNVSGNPRFPEVKTSITPRESSMVQIDTDLQKQLRDDLIRVFSLTPEVVDGMNQADFAQTLLDNNLMLLKRVLILQGKTNPMLTDYVRTFTYNSGILVDELLEIIEANADKLPDEYKEDPEGFLEAFLSSLTVKLPAPETDNLAKQMENFKKFSDSLDMGIEAFLKEEFFDGYADDAFREALPTVIASWKGIKLREWMRKHGIFRELDVFNNAEDGSPLMDLTDEMATHVDAVMKSVASYAKKVAQDAWKRRKKLEEAKAQMDKTKDAMGGGGTDDMPPAAADDVPATDAPAGGEDDFGLGDDLTGLGDETPPGDEPQSTEPQQEETPAETDKPEGDETQDEDKPAADDTGTPPDEGGEQQEDENAPKE